MPTYPKRENYIHYEGKRLTAEWYYTVNGELPGFDYYMGMSKQDMVRFDQIVRHLCDSSFGTILPLTLYRVEDRQNKIYAFKPRDERFFNFTTDGAKIIITNAYHKHSQQMTKADIECLKIAIGYRQSYLKRVREETYYEN